MSRNQRLALVGLAAVVLIAGFLVARAANDDSDSAATATTTVVRTAPGSGAQAADTVTRTVPEQTPKVPTVVVRDGKPVGGVRTLTFRKGDTIAFKVRAGAPGGEVHLHGYDVHRQVPAAGGTVAFELPAKFDGRFEVEMEATGVQIAQLEVQP